MLLLIYSRSLGGWLSLNEAPRGNNQGDTKKHFAVLYWTLVKSRASQESQFHSEAHEQKVQYPWLSWGALAPPPRTREGGCLRLPCHGTCVPQFTHSKAKCTLQGIHGVLTQGWQKISSPLESTLIPEETQNLKTPLHSEDGSSLLKVNCFRISSKMSAWHVECL